VGFACVYAHTHICITLNPSTLSLLFVCVYAGQRKDLEKVLASVNDDGELVVGVGGGGGVAADRVQGGARLRGGGGGVTFGGAGGDCIHRVPTPGVGELSHLGLADLMVCQ
jgi:hypothetical protein